MIALYILYILYIIILYIIYYYFYIYIQNYTYTSRFFIFILILINQYHLYIIFSGFQPASAVPPFPLSRGVARSPTTLLYTSYVLRVVTTESLAEGLAARSGNTYSLTLRPFQARNRKRLVPPLFTKISCIVTWGP